MSDCNHDCSSCSQSDCDSRAVDFRAEANAASHIRHVIGIVSGKGGVGKSFVTGQLAHALERDGYRVGVLDADITGPSIPKMFGIHEPAYGSEAGIMPAVTPAGIKVISINMMLDDEETPVIWRGPVLAGVVKQFWTDVVWGELDYLLVDMPPGTGDVVLTVFQSLPVDGVVIVTTPQDLVNMIVKKAYNMAAQMQIPVLGMVQNMSYVLCPDCGKKIYIYGEGRGEDIAASLGIPAFDALPVMDGMASACDDGTVLTMEPAPIVSVLEKLESLEP